MINSKWLTLLEIKQVTILYECIVESLAHLNRLKTDQFGIETPQCCSALLNKINSTFATTHTVHADIQVSTLACVI